MTFDSGFAKKKLHQNEEDSDSSFEPCCQKWEVLCFNTPWPNMLSKASALLFVTDATWDSEDNLEKQQPLGKK